MNVYGELEEKLHSFLTSALDSVSDRLQDSAALLRRQDFRSEARSAAGPVWMLWRKLTSLDPARHRTTIRCSCSALSIQRELYFYISSFMRLYKFDRQLTQTRLSPLKFSWAPRYNLSYGVGSLHTKYNAYRIQCKSVDNSTFRLLYSA